MATRSHVQLALGGRTPSCATYTCPVRIAGGQIVAWPIIVALTAFIPGIGMTVPTNGKPSVLNPAKAAIIALN